MTSFVIFKILNELYGIDIEGVKRILPSQFLTAMPDEDTHIEGMFTYEGEIIKVMSFRKMIGVTNYDEQLHQHLAQLQAEHKIWLEALRTSVEQGSAFEHESSPHSCALGKWIDSIHPDDKELVEAMKTLGLHHQNLHQSALDLLEEKKVDKDGAKRGLDGKLKESYEMTMNALGNVAGMSTKVAVTLQRCLVLIGEKNRSFGINIDEVVDILHIDEKQLHITPEAQKMGDFMRVAGILDYKGKLITIIKDITINKRSA